MVREQLFPHKPPGSRLALYFGLATWIQPSQPTSPRPSSFPGANLVLAHRLPYSFSLSAAVRQVWCHDRWYQRSVLWIQLAVHHQRHRIWRLLVTARPDSLPSPRLHGLSPPRLGGSQGRVCVDARKIWMCSDFLRNNVCMGVCGRPFKQNYLWRYILCGYQSCLWSVKHFSWSRSRLRAGSREKRLFHVPDRA